MQKIHFWREKWSHSRNKRHFTWVLFCGVYNLFIFSSVLFESSANLHASEGLRAPQSQSPISMAVLPHFHCSRVPSLVNSEAVFRVQQHEVFTSLKNVLLKANFLFGQTLILLLSLQAACHKERHVSRKAVSFIHDILTEVLTNWNEPSHFHFNEALFRPFERIMQLELCDEDVQDQASQPWSGCLYLAYRARKKGGLQGALAPLESISRVSFIVFKESGGVCLPKPALWQSVETVHLALKQLNKTFYYLKKKKVNNKLLQTDIVSCRNVFKAILISSEGLSISVLVFCFILLISPTWSAGGHLYRRIGGNVFYPDPIRMETPVQCSGNSAQQQQVRG